MPRGKVLTIVWTDRAIQNTIAIKLYLSANFSSKEFEHFLSILQTFEITVCTFPEIYPKSTIKKNIRRAVISKVLSVFYRIRKGKIEVLAILDNRCDISNWI